MNLPRLTVYAGQGRCSVELTAIVAGEGFSLTLTGGEKPHVGGAAICYPNEDGSGQERCQEICLPGHRDIEAARLVAEAVCRATGVATAVVCGIHIDDATAEEIETILSNCADAAHQITSALNILKKRDANA